MTDPQHNSEAILAGRLLVPTDLLKKTNIAKVVMFGINPNPMKCRFALTYFYDLLTYLTL
jgi:hypothetical protein